MSTSKEQITNLDYPKIQFEVRFTHIIASNVIREVLNPFLKIASSFTIQNQGLLEEQIRLNFDDDNFSIICSWDRIILISEEDLNRFSVENSSISVLFDILKKLSSVESFGVFTNYLYNVYVLKRHNAQGTSNSMSIFRDKFLNTAPIDNILKNPSDYSITIEKEEGTKLTTIIFGPFNNKDIEKHGLFPLKKSNSINIINHKGDLISIRIFNKTSSIDLSVLKKLINETNQLTSSI